MAMPESEERERQAAAEAAGGEDTAALEKALAEAKAKAEEYLAGWQRTQADFINYKRRTEQEREETVKFASSGLMLAILPVLDDLGRALDAVPARIARLGWAEGVRLIGRKLQNSLEGQGLSPIKALGEPFDPNLHEATRLGKGREGIVVEEIEKGYKLNDRVLRPAKVVVGNGEEEEKED